MDKTPQTHSSQATETPGLVIDRYFTTAGVDPFDQVEHGLALEAFEGVAEHSHDTADVLA